MRSCIQLLSSHYLYQDFISRDIYKVEKYSSCRNFPHIVFPRVSLSGLDHVFRNTNDRCHFCSKRQSGSTSSLFQVPLFNYTRGRITHYFWPIYASRV